MNKLLRRIGALYIGFFMLFTVVAGTVNADNDTLEGWTPVKYTNYEASVGDYFLVDIQNGYGYLLNENQKHFTAFPVMTGGRGTPTPVKEWVVKQKNIQSNRIFFGETGEFLRMYMNGGATRTGYGIHGYAYFQREIDNGRKFLSWGCVMVADDVLDLIEESYLLNGEMLRVSTRANIDISSYLMALNEIGINYL